MMIVIEVVLLKGSKISQTMTVCKVQYIKLTYDTNTIFCVYFMKVLRNIT